METAQLLKDKENYDPSKINNKILFNDHRIIHAWWDIILKNDKIKGWSKEDVYNAHKLIAKEIVKRSFEHDTPLSSTLFNEPRDNKTKKDMIFLPSILKAFNDDIIICEDFISLVGGACTNGKTMEDLNILIKCPEPKAKSPLGIATKFRLAKALSGMGIKENRAEFLYDDFAGPFNSHIHLYDLVLKLKPKKELHQMNAELTQSVTPFSFVTQPKPLHGRFKEEIYSPETVVEVIEGLKNWRESLPDGVFVEQQFDGIRCQVHKLNDKIIIWDEEKKDITNKLPSLVSELKKINHNFITEGELELWKTGKHQNREDTATTLKEKEISIEEPNLLISLYDLMWIDEKDIHFLDFKDRLSMIQSNFSTTKRIKLSVPKLVKSLDDLKEKVSEAAKLPGSEGAMIKMSDYKYPLKLHTSQMIKFKNEFSINVEIIEVHDIKDSNSKNYLTAVKQGKKLIPCGKTYDTNIKAEVGDVIRVIFVELSKYIDSKTKQTWYNFWSPRVIEKVKQVDDITIADKLVSNSSGQITEKKFPTRYKNLLEEESYINEFINSALLWETEEFDFALSQGWIKEPLIPEKLSSDGSKEIRNSNNFILKKEVFDRAVICLRDSNNKIETEKKVCLVEG